MSARASGYENGEFVEQATAEVREQQQESQLSRAEALETKRRLLESRATETETVLVSVEGEEVEMEPLSGLGEKTGLARRMIEADRAGDEDERLIVLDDMVQRLADHSVHGDVFDREFWDGFDDEAIREAYQDLGLKSRGGQSAGN